MNVIEKVNPPPATTARFFKDFTAYLNSLPEEAADRASGRLRSIDEHFELRRQTGGLQPSFVFNVMHLDFAEEVSEHPHIVRMKMATGDLVIIANVSCILTSLSPFFVEAVFR
jgi:Delta6-protoilludene synthase